jgi:hypothetical protein
MFAYNSQMSKLPIKFIIAILAIGALVGATTTTVISGGLKPSNLALAQLRVPFLPQRPLVQAPLQQPLTTTASTSGGGSFGPNCNGCVTTQSLANGAVTTPKIAPGAVTISTTEVAGPSIHMVNAGEYGLSSAFCPSGSIVTGGGYSISNGAGYSVDSQAAQGNGWSVTAYLRDNNTGAFINAGGPINFNAFAMCATLHP